MIGNLPFIRFISKQYQPFGTNPKMFGVRWPTALQDPEAEKERFGERSGYRWSAILTIERKFQKRETARKQMKDYILYPWSMPPGEPLQALHEPSTEKGIMEFSYLAELGAMREVDWSTTSYLVPGEITKAALLEDPALLARPRHGMRWLSTDIRRRFGYPTIGPSGEVWVEIVEPVPELELAYRFAASRDPEEYTQLAREILAQKPDAELRRKIGDALRDLVAWTTADQKRACLLQTLAHLHDNESLGLFIDEIKRYAEGTEKPSRSLIAALTYVRLLEIPENLRRVVAISIQLIARKFWHADFPRQKAFKAGVLITLGAIARLEDTVEFLLEVKDDEDPEILEEYLDDLSDIFRRTMKNTGTLDPYREKLSRRIHRLLNVNAEVIEKTKRREITAELRLVSRGIELLTRIDPNYSLTWLPRIFQLARKKQSTYLLVAVARTAKGLPEQVREKTLRKISEVTKIPVEAVAGQLLSVF